MKLLIVTQIVDKKDTVLSFMHTWITKFAAEYEEVIVICLKKGEYDLPENVRVFSLGKESGESRIKYIKNFYRLITAERKKYDAVWVHMNQEYILLAGLLWKIWGKRIYMWRNHHAGSWLTHCAVCMCNRVFCTSKYSYTARFKKTILMPVGIDTEVFNEKKQSGRVSNSILFLARIAPVKKPDLLIAACGIVRKQTDIFSLSVYGDPLPKDITYAESLKTQVEKLGLGNNVNFYRGVPNTETVSVYNTHDICVNLSSSGMFDKTIFEAMACGTLSLSSNLNLIGEIDERLLFKEGDVEDVARKLSVLIGLDPVEKDKIRYACRVYVEKKHSLKSLSKKLSVIMAGNDYVD